MGISLTTTMTIEGNLGSTLDRAAAALRSPRTFMRQVGIFGLTSAELRLEKQLRTGSESRTGRLRGSLTPGREGSIFEVSDYLGEYGTNLSYAAQVHYGGTIVPREQKALAIPLTDRLKRDAVGPRDIDPDRILLQFVPYRGGRPDIIGVLVDPEEEQGPGKSGRKRKPKRATPYGPGPLFILMRAVYQLPNPFLYWSDEDQRIVEEEMWPRFLGLA